MRLVCISDTHGKHRDLVIPECDILLHAGDMTMYGEHNVLMDLNVWLGEQTQAQYKVVIAGNHDTSLEHAGHGYVQSILSNAIYLEDCFCKIEDFYIYGSPMTPRFGNWAFMEDRGERIARRWEAIRHVKPDILLTHGPPHGILDKTHKGLSVGCESLADIVRENPPLVHIFGHIHEGYGTLKKGKTTFVNAASVNFRYEQKNSPIVIDI